MRLPPLILNAITMAMFIIGAWCGNIALAQNVRVATTIPPTTWVQIQYSPARTAQFIEYRSMMQRDQWLEAFGAIIEEKVQQNPPLYLTADECGQENAFYAREQRRIVMCYELVRGYVNNAYLKLKAKIPNEALVDAIVGGVMFTFFHELGHAILHLTNAPFLGREEDVADQFSTYMILSNVDRRHIRGIMLGATIAYQENKLFYSRRHFANEHALSPQRRYNLACWAFGSSPNEFKGLAEYVGLPASRAQRCADEYNNLKRGVESVFGAALKRQ